jgi:uncharacterized membrane protein
MMLHRLFMKLSVALFIVSIAIDLLAKGTALDGSMRFNAPGATLIARFSDFASLIGLFIACTALGVWMISLRRREGGSSAVVAVLALVYGLLFVLTV